jgi:hypothetical protein
MLQLRTLSVHIGGDPRSGHIPCSRRGRNYNAERAKAGLPSHSWWQHDKTSGDESIEGKLTIQIEDFFYSLLGKYTHRSNHDFYE